MKRLTTLFISTLLLSPALLFASEHGHSHNHFSPTLEATGNDIISLTVCYKNGYLTDQDQEPAFKNLIKHTGATGEELGMFYMDSLGAKAEMIMSDDSSRALWSEDFCSELTATYLDENKLQQKIALHATHHDVHHSHDHHNHDHGEHKQNRLSAEMLEEDVARGRLLSIN